MAPFVLKLPSPRSKTRVPPRPWLGPGGSARWRDILDHPVDSSPGHSDDRSKPRRKDASVDRSACLGNHTPRQTTSVADRAASADMARIDNVEGNTGSCTNRGAQETCCNRPIVHQIYGASLRRTVT